MKSSWHIEVGLVNALKPHDLAATLHANPIVLSMLPRHCLEPGSVLISVNAGSASSTDPCLPEGIVLENLD